MKGWKWFIQGAIGQTKRNSCSGERKRIAALPGVPPRGSTITMLVNDRKAVHLTVVSSALRLEAKEVVVKVIGRSWCE